MLPPMLAKSVKATMFDDLLDLVSELNALCRSRDPGHIDSIYLDSFVSGGFAAF